MRADTRWCRTLAFACASCSSSSRPTSSQFRLLRRTSARALLFAELLLLLLTAYVLANEPIPQAADILTIVNVDTAKDVRLDANLHIPGGGELLLDIQVPRKVIRVDANGPAKITRVYSDHADGTWGVGEEIRVFVEFTSAVEVVGAPSLLLRTGCHASQCHTREIQRLRCQATAGKFSVGFAAQTVRNIPWNANQRLLSDYLTRMSTLDNVLVDYSISDTACTYFGNNITVTFESVNIDGSDGDLPEMTADRNNGGGDGGSLFHIRYKQPTLTSVAWEIQKGSRVPDRAAAYAGQPNPRTLQFTYTVLPGDNAARLDYTGSDALGVTVKQRDSILSDGLDNE